MKNKITIYLCQYITPVNGEIVFERNGAIAILKNKIVSIGSSDFVIKNTSNLNTNIIDFKSFIAMPGLYDMHFHYVQDAVRLKPKSDLLNWLEKFTWPYEDKFKNKSFAKRKATEFSLRLVKVGTVGGGCYASIHKHSVEYALKYFKGNFIVGNVLMTMNSPKYLLQKKEDAINIVLELSKKFKEKYVVTPRFAITTDPFVMKKTAAISKKNNSYIQTHLSETKNEISFVLDIFKNFKNFSLISSYTEIYNKCDLINKKSLLGHGIYLSTKELKLISKKKATIVHCPTSNAPLSQKGLGSGLFNFEKADLLKANWLLGSDIGGGPYLSMFDVMRSFIKQHQFRKPKLELLKICLLKSTIESAKFLNLDKTNGSLEEGKTADIIFVKGLRSNKSVLENLLTIIERTPRIKMVDLVYLTIINGIKY